jgi:O-antigen/teichoic acid export membrane protein
VLAASFMLVPLGMPSMSLLRRDMEFHSLAAVGIGSSAANLIATALLAVSGFGYMSLVWGSLIGNTVRTAASIACRPTFWAFRPGLTEWRKVFAFGSYSAATAIVNVFHDTLPQLIIGRLLGFNAVGLFGRAVGVCQLPDRLFTNALMPVLLPALAEHARSSNDLKPVYLRSLTYTTALQWPILLCLAVLAEPVVRILLGEQWLAAAPLVRIMALAALTLFPAFMTYPLLVATGGVRDTLTMSLISIPPSVILIFLASFHGLQAVAATQFITGPLQVYVALIFVRRRIDFTWGEFISALGPSAVIALCAATPPMAMVIYAGFRFNLSVPAMILASAGAVAGWVAGLFITHHPLLAEVRAVVSGLPWHMLRPARSP